VLFTALVLDGIDLLRSQIEAAVAGPGSWWRSSGAWFGRRSHLWERRFLFALHRREHKPTGRTRASGAPARAPGAVVKGAVREAIRPASCARWIPDRGRVLLALLRAMDHAPASDSPDALAASVFDLFLCGAGTPKGENAWKAARRRSAP
jgi:hypothetical protein